MAYVIGRGGVWERLGLGVRLVFGPHTGGGYLARWDQVDVSNPARPRLVCAVEELQKVPMRMLKSINRP